MRLKQLSFKKEARIGYTSILGRVAGCMIRETLFESVASVDLLPEMKCVEFVGRGAGALRRRLKFQTDQLGADWKVWGGLQPSSWWEGRWPF